MEKTVFRREGRGDDAVAASAVRTRHEDFDFVQLDGICPLGDTPRECAERGLWFFDEFLRKYCDGSLADVTTIRHYVRADLLPDVEFAVGAACREYFEPPELPATVMVGVGDVVGGDAPLKMEAEARIPHERCETEVVELPPPPGYTTSADRSDRSE